MDYVRAMTAEVIVPSDLFPAELDIIDNIITSTLSVATRERNLWDQLIYSRDDIHIRLSAIDATLDLVSYAQDIRNITDENDFARSMGLAHEFLSKTNLDQLFVMKPLIPLFVHSITSVRQTSVKAYHLSKIWGIDI